MSRADDTKIAEWLGCCAELKGKWWYHAKGVFRDGNYGTLAAAKFNQPVSEKNRHYEDGSIKWEECDGLWYTNVIPRYTTSDADAITLLPILVERGYEPEMWHNALTKMWWVAIFYPTKRTKSCEVAAPTIAAAISSAVLELIEREGK
jgi:hypothetical protein